MITLRAGLLTIVLAASNFSVATRVNAACDASAISTIYAALTTPLDMSKAEFRDLPESEWASLEGGDLSIYRDPTGAVSTIVRADGGETYSEETRLSVVTNSTWGISVAHSSYLNQIGSSGAPLGVRRTETDYYFFCEGKLYRPEVGIGEDDEPYERAGLERKDFLFATSGVSELVKQLK